MPLLSSPAEGFDLRAPLESLLALEGLFSSEFLKARTAVNSGLLTKALTQKKTLENTALRGFSESACASLAFLLGSRHCLQSLPCRGRCRLSQKTRRLSRGSLKYWPGLFAQALKATKTIPQLLRIKLRPAIAAKIGVMVMAGFATTGATAGVTFGLHRLG